MTHFKQCSIAYSPTVVEHGMIIFALWSNKACNLYIPISASTIKHQRKQVHQIQSTAGRWDETDLDGKRDRAVIMTISEDAV